MPARSFRNVYLLTGIWGDFRPASNPPPNEVLEGLDLLHTLDSWGIHQLPWLACDSGADLVSGGPFVLRAWSHVDLGNASGALLDDVPVRALLRSNWDALKAYGTVALTGVDASVPTERAGAALAQRVAGATIRPDNDLRATRSAYLQVASESGPDRTAAWDIEGILEAINAFLPAQPVVAQPLFLHPPQAIEHPFFPQQEGFAATVTLRDWAIDDAAWVVEVAAQACHESGIGDDVLISVREDGTPPS